MSKYTSEQIINLTERLIGIPRFHGETNLDKESLDIVAEYSEIIFSLYMRLSELRDKTNGRKERSAIELHTACDYAFSHLVELLGVEE
jgi:hypothetical protein